MALPQAAEKWPQKIINQFIGAGKMFKEFASRFQSVFFQSMVAAKSKRVRWAAPKEIPLEQLQRSYRAGLEIQRILKELRDEETSLTTLLLRGKPHLPWEHYPWESGILDKRTSSQYFYHSHPKWKEHGHFHTFFHHKRKMLHLVAIGLDKNGNLANLYTFNRWSTGDSFVPAEKLKGFLPRFRIGVQEQFDTRVHSFVNNVLILFRPEIEQLFDERDQTFFHYREKNGGKSPYEDRKLEITSGIKLNLEAHLGRIKAALAEREGADISQIIQQGASESPGESAAKPASEFGNSTLERLEKRLEAGQMLQTISKEFRLKGKTVVDVVMNEEPFREWKIYPWEGGVQDQKRRSQYFYHCHPNLPEHGHFHVFHLHKKKIAHLVAISMDDEGNPMELFTVNRWVTGDKYFSAKYLKGFLSRFTVESERLDAGLHSYIQGLLVLFQDEIEKLVDERDETFGTYRRENGGRSPFEDRELEITSSTKVSIDEKIDELSRAIGGREGRKKGIGGR